MNITDLSRLLAIPLGFWFTRIYGVIFLISFSYTLSATVPQETNTCGQRSANAPKIIGDLKNHFVECDDEVLPQFGEWVKTNLQRLSTTTSEQVTWTFDPMAPYIGCDEALSTTSVKFIATNEDGESNWVSADFIIQNKFPAKFITPLVNKTINCGEIPVFDTPIYIDGCGETTLTYQEFTSPGTCGGIAAITRIWRVLDVCNGNAATTAQTIFFDGNANIQFTKIPSDKTITCSESFEFDPPIFVSSCEAYELYEEDHAEYLCGGTESLTRTWVIANQCEESISLSQTITIIDNEPPVFVSFPEDITSVCQEIFDYGTPEVDDACGQVGLIYVDQMKGNCYDGLTILRTWSATDACGNATSRVQRIELLPIDKSLIGKEEASPVFDDALHIVPNPTTHLVTFKFRLPKADLAEITVYDLKGNVMLEKEKQLEEGQYQEVVDISAYPEGAYIVMVQHNGKWLSRQFVKVPN